MANAITQDRCIRCNACLPDNPNEGVTVTNAVFVVDPRLCAECAGTYARSLCAVAGLVASREAEAAEEADAILGRADRRARRKQLARD